jgi:hypothetical protein
MSRADYAHWNEDADYMWWMEEGRHPEEPPDPFDHDDRYDPDEEEEDNEVLCYICEEPIEDGQLAGEISTEVAGHLTMALIHKECQP